MSNVGNFDWPMLPNRVTEDLEEGQILHPFPTGCLGLSVGPRRALPGREPRLLLYPVGQTGSAERREIVVEVD